MQKEQHSQTVKELTIVFSLNEEIIVVFALFCIFQVFSKILISPTRKRKLLFKENTQKGS